MARSRKKGGETQGQAVPQQAVEFLLDADAIQQRKLPRIARCTLYLVVAAILIAVTWASIGKIDAYVTARGKIVTDGPHIVLQPLETSIVKDVHVRKGQFVKKGDVLLEFDPTFSASDFAELTSELEVLTTRLERLQAEAEDKAYEPENPTVREQLEAVVAEKNKAERLSKRLQMEAHYSQLTATIKRLKSEKE